MVKKGDICVFFFIKKQRRTSSNLVQRDRGANSVKCNRSSFQINMQKIELKVKTKGNKNKKRRNVKDAFLKKSTVLSNIWKNKMPEK